MLDRVYCSTSCWSYFSEECDHLTAVFSRLKYPQHLINSTVKSFIASKVEDLQPRPAQRENPTVWIVLPFKDQDSADLVHKQLKDLSLKTHTVIQLVFVSDKIQWELKVHGIKPPIVNQQRVIYKFQCDLSDASFVSYVYCQRMAQHTKQSSSTGKHFNNKHFIAPKDVYRHFSVLRKCLNKFNCLVHEMLLIRELTPSLNVQSDSIQANLFGMRDISYVITKYVNLEWIFWQFIFLHLNLKMVSCHWNIVLSYP